MNFTSLASSRKGKKPLKIPPPAPAEGSLIFLWSFGRGRGIVTDCGADSRGKRVGIINSNQAQP